VTFAHVGTWSLDPGVTGSTPFVVASALLVLLAWWVGAPVRVEPEPSRGLKESAACQRKGANSVTCFVDSPTKHSRCGLLAHEAKTLSTCEGRERS
jgi:hypothetical protein